MISGETVLWSIRGYLRVNVLVFACAVSSVRPVGSHARTGRTQPQTSAKAGSEAVTKQPDIESDEAEEELE